MQSDKFGMETRCAKTYWVIIDTNGNVIASRQI